MQIAETFECGCNPGKAYASRSSFKNHFGSNRHKAWEKDRHTDAKTAVAADVLARKLEACTIENRALAKRIADLESAIFSMPNKRAVTDSQKKKVAAGQKWKCEACKSTLSHVFEVDHIKPLFLGGGNSSDNLQALCRECHGKKTLDDKEKFRARGSL
jgi:5-methylcytosine-specific restriction protein A